MKTQVLNMARIPVIQQCWKNGKPLRIHGLVYRLEDGILKDLQVSINKISDIAE